jgi:hypothetical protein
MTDLFCAEAEAPPLAYSSGQLVEEEIDGNNLAVAGNDEICSGVGWCVAGAASYPFEPTAIAQFLGFGNGLIGEFRVGGPENASDAIDLVAATVDIFAGIVEDAIFGPYLVDGRASALRVAFTEDVLKVP